MSHFQCQICSCMYFFKVLHWRVQRGEGGPDPPPPLKNHKNIGFRCNTGPDPLIDHKATKPAFNVGPSSARQQNASYWRFAGGPMITCFKWYFGSILSSYTQKKPKKKNPKKLSELDPFGSVHVLIYDFARKR